MKVPTSLWVFLAAAMLVPPLCSQVEPVRSVSLGHENATGLAKRRSRFLKSGRFLGWKFAARSGQDTSGWQRGVRKSQPLDSTDLFSQSTVGLSLAPGVANAGFALRGTLPAGFIPTAVTSGDFNEDGRMDFAVSNGGDNTVYVLLGNGDGTFKVPEILYTQGQSPSWLTAVKLNNTGHLDLAVTDADSNLLEVFTGNGDGTFKAGVQDDPLPDSDLRSGRRHERQRKGGSGGRPYH